MIHSEPAVSQQAQQVTMVGLMGYPIDHSLSPAMHNAAFKQLDLLYNYVLLPTPLDRVEEQIARCIAEGFAGWNVTVPHKQAIAARLDEMSDEVRATGACNTVRVNGTRLVGYNTDLYGFMQGLQAAGGITSGSKVVLLGAGGAARGVGVALAQAGDEVHILTRRLEQAADTASAISKGSGATVRHGTLDSRALNAALSEASLLVNCTPAGMWPHVDAIPLPDGTQLPEGLLVYDLVYTPRPTRLLQLAQQAGCRTQDGLAMLVHQGAAAFEIWTGKQAPVDTMMRACTDELSKRKQDRSA